MGSKGLTQEEFRKALIEAMQSKFDAGVFPSYEFYVDDDAIGITRSEGNMQHSARMHFSECYRIYQEALEELPDEDQALKASIAAAEIVFFLFFHTYDEFITPDQGSEVLN